MLILEHLEISRKYLSFKTKYSWHADVFLFVFDLCIVCLCACVWGNGSSQRLYCLSSLSRKAWCHFSWYPLLSHNVLTKFCSVRSQIYLRCNILSALPPHHLPEFFTSRLFPACLFQIPHWLFPQMVKLNVAAACWKHFHGCPLLEVSRLAASFLAS